MIRQAFLLGFVVLLALSGQVRAQNDTGAQASACEVTKPNDVGILGQTERGSYGNGRLSVGPFGLWPDGTVVFKPGGAGFVTQDGSLGMKFGWRRGTRGFLGIEGRRLDAPALPLRADINDDGRGDFAFVATALIFSTPGCWEVTGHVGDTSLTFVTKVVKFGEGPARYDPSLRSWSSIASLPKALARLTSPPNKRLHRTAVSGKGVPAAGEPRRWAGKSHIDATAP